MCPPSSGEQAYCAVLDVWGKFMQPDNQIATAPLVVLFWSRAVPQLEKRASVGEPVLQLTGTVFS